VRRTLAVSLAALLLLTAVCATASATTAVMSVTPNPVELGKAVTLDASSSTCSPGPCNYAWFDSGTWIASGRTATATFSAIGSQRLGLVVYDNTEKQSHSATTTLVVNAPAADTTAPTVTLTAPADGSSASGTVTMTADASDDRGVDHVTFRVDGNAVDTEGTAPYSYAWDSTTVADGSHTLSAQAVDAAGNVGTSSDATVTVSNAPPDTTPADYIPNLTQTVTGGTYGTLTPASNTEYRDCTVDWINLTNAHDVKFTNCNMGGLGGPQAGATRIMFSGGDFGPEGCSNGSAVHPTIAGSGSPAPSYITVDGVLIHDMTRGPACSSAHTEGFQVGSGTHLRFTNNTFRHNSIMDLFTRAWDTRGIQDVTIQGNYFGALAQDDGTNPGFYSLKITGNDPGRDVSGFHLVGNTCEAQPFSVVDAGSAVVENWGNTGC